jgi:phage replication-related protein YjqB (UPF0714/DUF867 family)
MAGQDTYPSLDQLKKELKDGVDFRTRVLVRNLNTSQAKTAPVVTVIAPHGGRIDPGTSAIARALAGRNWNLFDFQGLYKADPYRLHVTSTRFRDQRLTQLLEASDLAIGVHSMSDAEHETVWLGGLNRPLKTAVAENLRKRGFLVDTNCPRYRGEDPGNVCNLARNKGIQLELPLGLVKKMFVGNVFFRPFGPHPKTTMLLSVFTQAVRLAVVQFANRAGKV